MKLLFNLLLITLFAGCLDNRTPQEIMLDLEEKFAQDDLPGAIKDIETLQKQNYQTSSLFYYKGLYERKTEKKQAALLSFQKSIELDTSNYKSYVERAKLKNSLKDYNGAIQDCELAKFIKIDYPEIYKTKGNAYENLNDISNAMVGYQDAIKFNIKDGGETYFLLGKLLLNQNPAEACQNLSKSGELGYMDAYHLINSNCNSKNDNKNSKSTDKKNSTKRVTTNNSHNTTLQQSGQYRNYPNRYSITIPHGWDIDEISNLDKSMMNVMAMKEGNSITIIEMDPKIYDSSYNAKSVKEYDKEEFLTDYREKYKDFKLLDFRDIKINNIDAYYYKTSFSFFSTKLNKQVSGANCQFILINPKNRKVYSLNGSSSQTNIDEYEPIFKKTFETFKFN
jgi:hypothetical protein